MASAIFTDAIAHWISLVSEKDPSRAAIVDYSLHNDGYLPREQFIRISGNSA
ncbi:hypothetical protein RLW55_02130 [Hyphomicrobium sp. B1]|uniref:hypothetical protein n=1 Tax=Hyphomicrobium sp. B1 TaxID=3075651 RepID=UPI003C2C8364